MFRIREPEFSVDDQDTDKCLTDKDRSTTGKIAMEFIIEQILTVPLLPSKFM